VLVLVLVLVLRAGAACCQAGLRLAVFPRLTSVAATLAGSANKLVVSGKSWRAFAFEGCLNGLVLPGFPARSRKIALSHPVAATAPRRTPSNPTPA
jgi:hypothetical protein